MVTIKRRKDRPQSRRASEEPSRLDVVAAMLALVYLVPGALKRLGGQSCHATSLEAAWACYAAAHQVAGAVVCACLLTGVWAAWAMPVLAGRVPPTPWRLAFVALKCGAMAVSATPVVSVNAGCRVVRHLGTLALAMGATVAAGPMLAGADRPDVATLGRLTYTAVAAGTLGVALVATVASGAELNRILECGTGILLYSAPVAMQMLVRK